MLLLELAAEVVRVVSVDKRLVVTVMVFLWPELVTVTVVFGVIEMSGTVCDEPVSLAGTSFAEIASLEVMAVTVWKTVAVTVTVGAGAQLSVAVVEGLAPRVTVDVATVVVTMVVVPEVVVMPEVLVGSTTIVDDFTSTVTVDVRIVATVLVPGTVVVIEMVGVSATGVTRP